jgi:hypothetical protein
MGEGREGMPCRRWRQLTAAPLPLRCSERSSMGNHLSCCTAITDRQPSGNARHLRNVSNRAHDPVSLPIERSIGRICNSESSHIWRRELLMRLCPLCLSVAGPISESSQGQDGLVHPPRRRVVMPILPALDRLHILCYRH